MLLLVVLVGGLAYQDGALNTDVVLARAALQDVAVVTQADWARETYFFSFLYSRRPLHTHFNLVAFGQQLWRYDALQFESIFDSCLVSLFVFFLCILLSRR